MAATAAPAFMSRTSAKAASAAVISLAAGIVLWLVERYSYLLFHSLAEIFSISIAAAVFMISWSSRDYPEARPYVLLGIGYLFISFIDILHTLAYPGMDVLPQDKDYATELWVAARGLQAFTTLAFAWLMRLRRTAPNWLAFLSIGTLTAFALLSIFAWRIFPLCFTAELGLTPFKKASEYAISAILAASIAFVATNRREGSRQERLLLIAAFGINIASELTLTLYTSPYGVANLIGHFLKVGSFMFAYQALFASKIRARIVLIERLESSTRRLEQSEAGRSSSIPRRRRDGSASPCGIPASAWNRRSWRSSSASTCTSLARERTPRGEPASA